MSGLSKAEPLYASIKSYVLDGVQSGALKPNDRVPSEAELVETFGVSRMTVNRALRELKAEGVITRISGVGTFIAEAKPQGHLIKIRNIAAEVRERGHEYSVQVVQNALEAATPAAAGQIGVAAGTPLFHSILVHKEAGSPIQLEDRLVLASAAPDYGGIDFSAMTPNEHLTQAAPLQRVDHTVRAILPDRQTQALLGVPATEPCLLLIRRTWSRDRIVSYACLTHPSSRFEFSDSFVVQP